MTQYTTLHDAFISANDAAKAEGARSKALVMAKNDAKAALIPFARNLYLVVQGTPTVTNENKTLIGVHVRDTEPSPKPPPAQPPVISITSVVGRIVRGKLEDATAPQSKRRPPNAAGATILSFTGETPPPADSPMWKLEGQTGRNTFSVQFPDSVTAGTACWLIALWYNARGQYSPACDPIQTYLQIGPAAEAA
jgi:hypothetical protein